jgi:hypothetical protein
VENLKQLKKEMHVVAVEEMTEEVVEETTEEVAEETAGVNQ